MTHLCINKKMRKSLGACGRVSVLDVSFPDVTPVEVGDLEGFDITFAEESVFVR